MVSIHGMETMRNRWMTRQLQAALKALPVVVLTGARQTGKTTLAQALPQKRSFVSLDDLGVLGQAQTDPDSLLAFRPVTVDEVQRAPELLLPIKRQVDRQRKAGDVLLTGSANLLLMGKVAESLAGRAVYLELPPFCPAEWRERPGGLAPLDRLFETDLRWTSGPRKRGIGQVGCCGAGSRRLWPRLPTRRANFGLPVTCKPIWNAICANSAPCPACQIFSGSWPWPPTAAPGC